MTFEDKTGARRPRNELGRMISRSCPDPNCDGVLVHAGDREWYCDGLTHDADDGPLVECGHWHTDGEPTCQGQAAEWRAGRIWDGLTRQFRPLGELATSQGQRCCGAVRPECQA